MPAALRGAGHHRLVLGAAGLALLLAATVLAALAALTEHAVEGGTQRRLARDPDAVIAVLGDHRAPDTNTSTDPTPADGSDADRRSDADPASRDARASGDARAAPGIASASEPGADDVDTLVRAAVDRAFGGVPHHTWSALRAPASRSAELDVIEVDGHPRDDVRLSVVALEQSRRHTDLVVGRAPRGTGDGRTLETALDEVFAADLGVRPGDALRIRPGSGPEVTLRVTGLYRPSGTSPAVWAHLGTTTFGASDSVALVPRPALLATPGRTVRIRDGRTSTETLRDAPGAHAEEYAVLDRAGRLQLPRDHMERYGLRDRVRLTAEPDHVGIWAAGGDTPDAGPDTGTPAAGSDAGTPAAPDPPAAGSDAPPAADGSADGAS